MLTNAKRKHTDPTADSTLAASPSDVTGNKTQAPRVPLPRCGVPRRFRGVLGTHA